jgi:hypothetical protein
MFLPQWQESVSGIDGGNYNPLHKQQVRRRRLRNALKTFLAFLTLSVIAAVLLASYQARCSLNLRAFGDLPPSGMPGIFLQSMSSSDARISVRSLASLAEQRLAKRAQSYNMTYAAEEYGINFKYPSLVEYREAMHDAWDHFFQAQPHYPTGMPEALSRSPLREAVLRHLELASVVHTAGNDDDLPRKIYTTSKGATPDYAHEFEGWKDLSPEWEIVNYEDEKTLKWLKSMFSGKIGQKEPKLIHEFASLNRGVLKGEWQNAV